MIKRLFKLHIGLIKFLIKELHNKRTPKELIIFLRDVGKQYFNVLFQEYKNLFLIFDKHYQEQKNKRKQYDELRVKLQLAIKILKYIDDRMEKQGVNRQRRRQFWRDFYKSGQVRQDVFEDLLKEIK
jgi:methionine salvage enolase-phosphatase E1